MAETQNYISSPKISILIPVYNVEKYLRRCLGSIRAQTFTEFECICIDDGSPDGIGRILDENAELDDRFHVIHQENVGVSAARNAGLDAACGEWITFVALLGLNMLFVAFRLLKRIVFLVPSKTDAESFAEEEKNVKIFRTMKGGEVI